MKPQVLVTRPRHQAQSFVNELLKHGLDSIVFPTIEIRPASGWEIPEVSRFYGAFFTSPNSVDSFMSRIAEEAPQQLEALRNIKVFAVGKTTARDLTKYGITTEPIPKVADAVHLMESIPEDEIRNNDFLFLKGNLSLGVIPEVITRRGGRCHAITVYENHSPDLAAAQVVRRQMEDGTIGYISFTSPSTAQNFFKAMGTTDLPPHVKVAAIGMTTANALKELGVSTDIVPDYYDAPHFAEAIARAAHTA